MLLPLAAADVALVVWIGWWGHSWYALLPTVGTLTLLATRWWGLRSARAVDARWELHRQRMAHVLDPHPVPEQREQR